MVRDALLVRPVVRFPDPSWGGPGGRFRCFATFRGPGPPFLGYFGEKVGGSPISGIRDGGSPDHFFGKVGGLTKKVGGSPISGIRDGGSPDHFFQKTGVRMKFLELARFPEFRVGGSPITFFRKRGPGRKKVGGPRFLGIPVSPDFRKFSEKRVPDEIFGFRPISGIPENGVPDHFF